MSLGPAQRPGTSSTAQLGGGPMQACRVRPATRWTGAGLPPHFLQRSPATTLLNGGSRRSRGRRTGMTTLRPWHRLQLVSMRQSGQSLSRWWMLKSGGCTWPGWDFGANGARTRLRYRVSSSANVAQSRLASLTSSAAAWREATHCDATATSAWGALPERVRNFLGGAWGQDSVRQILVSLEVLDCCIEERLQSPRVRQPLLVAREVERAVDRDPIRAVLDRQAFDGHGRCVVGEGRELGHGRLLSAEHRFQQATRPALSWAAPPRAVPAWCRCQGRLNPSLTSNP